MSYKSPNRIPHAPIQRNYIAERPMQFVSCDHVGKLSTTNRGNCYILTFIDHFSKFIKLYAVPNQTAETTDEKFLDFACTFGFPNFLLSDKGKAFTSDMFTLICKRLGVTKLQTTALRPQTNGQSERINSNIKKSLSIFAQDTAQWDEYLNFYELFYYSSLHTGTNETPSYLHLAYDIPLPMDILQDQKHTEKYDYPEFVRRKTKQMRHTFNKVHQNLTHAAKIQEKYQNKNATQISYFPGPLVFLYSPEIDRNSGLPKRRNYRGTSA